MALKNIFKLFAGLLFAFYLLLGTAFPAEAGIISKQQEIEMGRETAMALEAQYGVWEISLMFAPFTATIIS